MRLAKELFRIYEVSQVDAIVVAVKVLLWIETKRIYREVIQACQ